jgi:bacteriocin-like protein
MTTNNNRELSQSNELRDCELQQVVGGRFDIGNIVSGVVKATTVVVAPEPPKVGFLGW